MSITGRLVFEGSASATSTLVCVTDEQVRQLIRESQIEASKTIELGDPPFGCIISNASGRVVAHAHNTEYSSTDPPLTPRSMPCASSPRTCKRATCAVTLCFANA